MSLYRGVILEHFRRPFNRGEIPRATAVGEAANPLCGDRLRMAVRVEANQIVDIGFAGDACAICVASASLLTQRVRGVGVEVAAAIDPSSVVAELHASLPEGRTRCATLPLDALRRALRVSPANDDVVALVLAAGSASRFGADKVTALLSGEPVVRHVVRALEGIAGRIVVVVGDNAEAVRQALTGGRVEIIRNPLAREGLSSSIVAGLNAMPECAAVMILLGDQPRIDRAVVSSVIDGWRAGGGAIIAPSYRGVRAPPVLFTRAVFAELRGLTGDSGAKVVLDRDPHRVMVVEVDQPVPVDVDTPLDLAMLEQQGEAGNRHPA